MMSHQLYTCVIPSLDYATCKFAWFSKLCDGVFFLCQIDSFGIDRLVGFDAIQYTHKKSIARFELWRCLSLKLATSSASACFRECHQGRPRMRRRHTTRSSAAPPVQEYSGCRRSSSSEKAALTQTQLYGKCACTRRVVPMCLFLALGLTQSVVIYKQLFVFKVCCSFCFRHVTFQTSCQNGSLGLSCGCIPERTNDSDCLFDCHSWNKSCRSSSCIVFLSPSCSSSCLFESSVSQGFAGSLHHGPAPEHSCRSRA